MRSGADSRLQGFGGEVTHAVLPYERTYCANCGKQWGWTTQDSSQYIAAAEISVVCDECFESLNSKDQIQRIPESEITRLGLIDEPARK
jgi:hypothetical protein